MHKKRYSLKAALAVCILGALSAITSTFSAPAIASVWPTERPVHIIVPFAPGGSNDVIARRLAEGLRQELGQAFIVENKPGAGSVVGNGHVAKSAPDGYTLLFVSGSLATSAGVQKTPYDTKTAFTPITTVAGGPFVLITRNDFPAKTVPELIEYAKANPGKINYGSAGLGDNAQLMSEMLAKATGMELQGIAYKGITPAQLDLYAGRIDIIFTTIASIKGTPSDTLPKIAFTGATRDPDFPDVPTIKEQTGLDYVVNVWWGLFGPAGMDPRVRDKLNTAVSKVVNTPDFEKFMAALGARPMTSTPDELQQLVHKDVDRWTETATAIGIRQ